MKLWQKILLTAILLPTLGVGVLYYYIRSAFDDMCVNSLISETPSPNKQMKIVTFERNCRSTTDFSTQVSVLPIDRPLSPRSESGNLFVADTDHGKAPSDSHGGPEVSVQWRGDRGLNITHHKAARVFLNRSKVQNITVIYSTFD